MALYEMTQDAFRAVSEASFIDHQIKERGDLQLRMVDVMVRFESAMQPVLNQLDV